MKTLILAVFMIASSPTFATSNEKPLFPNTFPNSKFDLSKIDRSRDVNQYCEQRDAIQGLHARAQSEDLKAELNKELGFLGMVCIQEKLVGLPDATNDSSSKFLVNFEIAQQGLSRMIKYYQAIDEEAPNSLIASINFLRDYAGTGLISALDKAYNPNGDVNIYALQSQISSWTSAITEWYMKNN